MKDIINMCERVQRTESYVNEIIKDWRTTVNGTAYYYYYWLVNMPKCYENGRTC